MKVLAARDGSGHVADDRAVAQHLVVFRQRAACDFVTKLDRLGERDALSLDLELGAGFEPRPCNQAVVLRT